MNDVYDSLPDEEKDDKIALVYQSNVDNMVSVKTAHGLTNRENIPSIVQQGGVWGPMQCSVTVDKVGKDCGERGTNLYMYRNQVRVLPLSMVDDLLGVSKCGNKSISLNSYINARIEMKRLIFHTPDINGKTKCHKMHVGKPNHYCPELRVHGTKMSSVQRITYLGEISLR